MSLVFCNDTATTEIYTLSRHDALPIGWARAATPAMPLVSILMPVHAQAAFVPRAIGSLLAQDVADWELVVVDDGSPDDVARKSTRLNSSHANISYAVFCLKKNSKLLDQ